ncbi:MAG: type II secretion system secretin GspD [Proteobacteria bacterium]|nr:type II secretion system secretin GspD [Pseudomonadota bacterium]
MTTEMLSPHHCGARCKPKTPARRRLRARARFARPRRGDSHMEHLSSSAGYLFSRLAAAAVAALLVLLPMSEKNALAQANRPNQGNQGTQTEVEEGLYSCGKAKGRVSVSFKPDIELKDLITWAMGFTCKNFVYDSGVGNRSKKVTIIAPKKMSPQQAWQVFLVAMKTMNLTIVPQGSVLRVIEAAQAKNEPLPLYKRGGPGATAQLVRMVIRPEHIPVEDLNVALSGLKSKDGQVTALPKIGIVVITDYGSIISKMRSLLAEIDQPIIGERLYMIKVQNADATELTGKLNEILTTSARPQTSSSSRSKKRSSRSKRRRDQPEPSGGEIEAAVPSKMVADERTNTIIVVASEAAYLRVRSLVKRLDVAIGIEGEGRIHVHYLHNANAEEMANTLTAVISGVSQPSTRNQGNRRTPARRPATTGTAAGSPAFEGQVRVTHDKPTNSLVVIASVKDYLALRNVVQRLDIPRRQVFIEAVILEVQADNTRDIGTSWHGGTATDDGAIALGGLQHSSLQSINPASLAGLSGLLGGVIGPLLDESSELLGVSIPSFGVLFQALATSNDVNILSSPHLLTTDNEEAEISVGENIPYQSSFSNFGTGGQTGTGGFAIPVQSVQRQDVALTLKITPHVNGSDMVRLEIDQEISDIASPNFGGLGPSWSKRTIKTTVVVRDQQSIVIGGLMRDRNSYTESKIPLLGDIPLLGYLFKATQTRKTKTNLLVLLTPYVIKDQMDIEQIVQRKVRQRNEFMRTFSSFARIDLTAQIDYRRKRGLIEEINHTLASIERDAETLREANMRRDGVKEGLIEYDGTESDAGGSGGGGPNPEVEGGQGAGPSSRVEPGPIEKRPGGKKASKAARKKAREIARKKARKTAE